MLVMILTATESAAPMVSHGKIEVLAGKGLSGDRYATGQGHYSGVVQWDAHVTLIAEEPFSEAARQGVALMPAVLRRNLVTCGVDLKALIGREFRIGQEVVLRGRKAWPPCSHVVKLSGRTEIFQYLAGGTGIGADALVGGTIRLGDRVEVIS